MRGAAFVLEVVLVKFALAHRPSSDQDPSTLAVAGTSEGAFRVLHSSTPTAGSAQKKQPYKANSTSQKAHTSEPSHLEAHHEEQKSGRVQNGGDVVPPGGDVVPPAPHNGATTVASVKSHNASPGSDASSQSHDGIKYVWTPDGAEWAAQFFSDDTAPQPGEALSPEQTETIRAASGEHDPEKGVSAGYLAKVQGNQVVSDASSLLQMAQQEPGLSFTRDVPSHETDVPSHESATQHGQAKESKKDAISAIQSDKDWSASRNEIEGNDTLTEQHGEGAQQKSKDTPELQVNHDEQQSERLGEDSQPIAKKAKADSTADGDAEAQLRKVLNDVSAAGVDQGSAINLQHIEEIRKAQAIAEKGGANHALLNEAETLIDVLENANKVDEERNAVGHDVHSEEEHEEHQPATMKRETLVSVVVALLLLGFITFDLCILYMVNYPDPQVKSYSYKMVSQTVSVLCAVLLETAQLDFFVQGIVFQKIWKENKHEDEDTAYGHGAHPLESELSFEAHDPHAHGGHGSSPLWEFVTCLLLFFAWFAAINILSKIFRKTHEGLFMVNAVVAHEAAFVCIHTFSDFQEIKAHEIQPGKPDLTQPNYTRWLYTAYPLGMLLFLRIMTLISEYMRDDVHSGSHNENAAAITGSADARRSLQNRSENTPPLPTIAEGEAAKDSEEEEDEAAEGAPDNAVAENSPDVTMSNTMTSKSERNSLCESREHHIDWFEYVSESEDEMCAIVIGNMLRQSTLYFVCGRIPMMEGDFENHSPQMFTNLVLAICVYVMLLTGTTYYIAKYHHSADSRVMQNKESRRFVEFLQMLWSMTIAWHILSLGRWHIQIFVSEHALQFVANAFLLSPLCIGVIVLVDKLADNAFIYENTAEIIIESVGLLVGFAWEKAFHHAAHTIIDFAKHEHAFTYIGTETAECILCLGLVAFMLPAWKTIIVPHSSQKVPEREWCQADPRASFMVAKRGSALIGEQIRASLSSMKPNV